jgi:hypothetical protein
MLSHGHMVTAACRCGFRREGLSPGASPVRTWVIAYTEDGRDLQTVEEAIAEEQGLPIIGDPFMHMRDIRIECPSCGNETLDFEKTGFWDGGL